MNRTRLKSLLPSLFKKPVTTQKRQQVIFRLNAKIFLIFFLTFTGQQITECVLIVPGFFGQAERNALLTAANLANIKVLQLINDYTAVALNYGIFRRNEINETAQYYVFYDMGAYKTSAAVVSYQLVKDKVTRETNPVLHVLGVGYDRTLGGLEMQLRLRDYLATEFNKLKKTPTDVFTNPRALAKLFKEAGRVKNVLSANANHFAQIEGLLDDQDFKFQVTREVFEELSKDLFDRVRGPLDRALANSGLTMDVINQVILFGGGTRVPKIQEVLKERVGQELGKNINMDEAAVMGAVYKAADLATGFKVKKIVIKDAVLFPIQVTFEREGESGNTKIVRRNLFSAMNSFPQKKMITFNKHNEDFGFNVNYADVDYLGDAEVANIGSLSLSTVELTKVASIIGANTADNIESKGIKAHFVLDDSGVFEVSGVELVLEKTVKDSDEEGAFSKLGSTISKLFSSDSDDSDSKKDEPVVEEGKEAGQEDEKSADTEATKESNDTKPIVETEASVNKTEPKERLVTVKEIIPSEIKVLFTVPLEGEQLAVSRKKIDDLLELERQITRRETALNVLESFCIEANQKLDETDYASCATEKEVDAVRAECAAVSDWLYEDGENADAEAYEARLKDLKKLTNDIYARHWEHAERHDAQKTLNEMIESARMFLKNSKNFTKEVNPDKDVYTQVEIETLQKVIVETDEWLGVELAEQEKLERHQKVRLTVKKLTDKMGLLDREVKYLVNKLKIWKPKVKELPKKEKKTKKKSSKNATESTEEKDEEKPTAEEQLEFPESEEPIEPTVTGEEETTPHSEL